MRSFIVSHKPTLHTERLANQSVVMAFCYSLGTVFAHSEAGMIVVAFGYFVSSVINYRRGGE